MKEPSTIKGFLSIMNKISTFTMSDKKGFDKLPHKKQQELLELVGAIENRMHDINQSKK